MIRLKFSYVNVKVKYPFAMMPDGNSTHVKSDVILFLVEMCIFFQLLKINIVQCTLFSKHHRKVVGYLSIWHLVM